MTPDPSRPGDRTAAWIAVGVVWLTLGIAFGLYFSFPVFFVPLLEEFGWSRGATAGAFSVSAVVQGLLSPGVGVLVDRLGPRRVMLAGSVLLSLAGLLGSVIGSLWSLYVITGVLGAAGVCAVGWVPTGALIARWFAERRGAMMGLAFSGMGVGILVMGPLAQWLISTRGWRQAYLVLGVATLVTLVPLVWFGLSEPPPLRRSGDERRTGGDAPGGAGVEVRAALATRPFWALFLAYFFTPLAVFPVVTHQVAFAVDQGYPRLFVAGIFGLTGFMSTAGRVVFGVLADRIGRAMSATLSYGCTAAGTVALLLLETWRTEAWLWAYAVLFGLGFGARGPIITTMAAQLFAGRRFGVIYGMMSVANGIGGAIGPWFGGALHDLTGSYRLPFLLAIGFCAAGSACFWLAVVPARDRR
ncbi:MAG: MFS transporter [Candidatus Rokubacteria bacterium]|nr:MFS transporter [Candidatus Rokubacteria bacterium]